MNLSEHEKEFQVRTYYWVISEFDREIAQSFPNLRLHKSGPGWKLFQFMQRLPLQEQRAFAHAFCRRGFQYVLQPLDQPLTSAQINLLAKYDALIIQPSSREREVQARSGLGEKIKFVSKPKLRKIVVEKFTKKFGPQCVRIETGPGWDPLFFMEMAGWLVLTQFTFGRHQTELSYRHFIQSKSYRHALEVNGGLIPPDSTPPPGPIAELTRAIAWIANQWDYLLEDEAEEAANAAITYCDYFFQATPNLLHGLEYEKIEATV